MTAMEILLPVLLLALLGIVVFAGRLYFRQDALVFRPSPELSRSPSDLGLVFEELVLHNEDGTRVSGWWVPGEAGSKAVILFYGSESNRTRELSTLHFLHSLGVHTLVVDYPGYGGSGGSPSEPGCYQAGEAAWSFLRETKGLPTDEIVIFGQSIGSAVGIYLAASRPCAGLVVHSGFTSVPDLAALAYPYLPVRYFCRTRMNSLRRIARCACPVLVLHSVSDEHIPIAQARRLYARAQGPKRFVSFYGSHFGGLWQHAPGVRTACAELLSGQIAHWQGGPGAPARHDDEGET